MLLLSAVDSPLHGTFFTDHTCADRRRDLLKGGKINWNGLSVNSESVCMASPECGNPAFSSRKRLWKICTLFFGNGSVTAFP